MTPATFVSVLMPFFDSLIQQLRTTHEQGEKQDDRKYLQCFLGNRNFDPKKENDTTNEKKQQCRYKSCEKSILTTRTVSASAGIAGEIHTSTFLTFAESINEPRGGLTMALQISSLSDDGSIELNEKKSFLLGCGQSMLLLKRKRKSMTEIWFPGTKAVSKHVVFPVSY